MEITRDLLAAERASLVAQRDEAARRAATADGAIQLVDVLLARLDTPEPEVDIRVPQAVKS